MRKIRQRKIPLSLEIAPLVDVVLLLLIFFLLTFSPRTTSMNLDLPEAEGESAQKEVIAILINEEGRVFVGGKEMDFDALFFFLKEKLSRSQIKEVELVADQHVPLKIPVQVMDVCKKAGAEGISIATVKKGG